MKPPHWTLTLTEAPRALADGASLLVARRLLLKLMPHGHGQGVMVIPGFLGGDGLNQPLVKFLGELGYSASGWGQGRNLGPAQFFRPADNERPHEITASRQEQGRVDRTQSGGYLCAGNSPASNRS